MRTSGPLTAAVGILLAAVTVFQAVYLRELGFRVRTQCVRSEMRGLAAALNARLERDLALLDHNAPSTERALTGLAADWPSLDWALLTGADGTRLACSGTAPALPAEELDAAARAPLAELPRIHRTGGDTLAALTRLRVGERDMVLAAGLSGEAAALTGPLWALGVGTLCAGLGAALLLVVRGLVETAAARRAGG
jgi:hypothetical protein